MMCVTMNYDVYDISDFQDSTNRNRVEDKTETNLISYCVTEFQNLHNMSLIIKQG